MENIIIITELLLFALGVSLFINATHIAFQSGMILSKLYDKLDSIFREMPQYVVYNYSQEFKNEKNQIIYQFISECGEYTKNHNAETNEDEYYNGCMNKIEQPIISMPKFQKYRDEKGLLIIAKPIYACASCMPSLWSSPLLFILPIWKVFIIIIFAVVISTVIADKLFE